MMMTTYNICGGPWR